MAGSLSTLKDPVPSFITACIFSVGLGFIVYFFLMRFMAGESIGNMTATRKPRTDNMQKGGKRCSNLIVNAI